MSMQRQHGNRDGKGTFIVEIRHQDGDTWQGKVTWAEGNRRENFRSTLELMKMMDSAVNSVVENDDFDERYSTL
ncbi:hypothetical protein [Butyrivibrio sp. NC3005]|uniref:hypothetical protein n=1 Tax=Butyrivibrio sp. NC3005 TaxID=1280685 RepID=UPI000404A29A|nr:hypothetical protein [Butyrivibrio sp. NC3005]